MTGVLLVLGIVAAVLLLDMAVGYAVGRACSLGDEIERRVGPEGRERLP